MQIKLEFMELFDSFAPQVSLRTSDRCHWCGNPHLLPPKAAQCFALQKETDSHASVRTGSE